MLILSISVGILLLVLLAVDVFGTVFHPTGRGGPLNRRLNRLVWAFFRTAVPRGRPASLTIAAPVMILTTLALWVLFLVAGFALLYLPWIDTFLAVDRPLGVSWVEAVYYSGYTAATLGFGDVVPGLPAFRLLAPIQAICGFALVSVSVTYLLATYSGVVPMRAVAAHVASYMRKNVDGGDPLEGDAATEGLIPWANDLAIALRRVLQSHFQYPVLSYFRPADPSQSLLVQLDRLLAWRDASGSFVWRTDPGLRVLCDAIDEFANEVDRNFVPERFVEHNARRGVADERTRDALDRVLRYMRYR